MPVYDIAARFRPNRDDVIVEWATGRRVLHIGACDAPYTRKKYERGLLLHPKLAAVASELRGIDLDKDAIELMAELGHSIDYFDMNNAGALDFRPEVIVFGETIEHLVNFDATFGSLRAIMGPDTRLVISTPNAFHARRFVAACFGREQTHPEHTCLFSLQTLRQLLARYELEIETAAYTFLPRRKNRMKRRLAMALSRIAPALGETLLVSARLQSA